MLCKRLVTIITDVPVKMDEKRLKYEPIDSKKLTDLFEELEFRTLLQRMLSNNHNVKINKSKVISAQEAFSTPAQGDLFTQVNR